MAQFEIDRQTINDLGLFADGEKNIYSFFNRTKTIGGERRLRQLIDTPSSNINILRSRSQTIKYFYDNQLQLPVSKKDIDFIEHYIAYNSSPLKANIFDATIGKVRNYLAPANDLYVTAQGIKDIHKLIIILSAFYGKLQQPVDEPAINAIAIILNSFLAKPDIQKLISTDPEKEMGFLQISYHDRLFRKIEKDALRQLLNTVYDLDAYIAIAQAAETYGFCFPEYLDTAENAVCITGLYHPGIKDALTNDVVIQERKNLFFVTGANMAGKSSFLKALGLAVYLSHIGFPVPAKSMQTSVFNGLITTINLADNINEGYSHYFSEVNRVKQTALKINEQSKLFIVLDELFKGTNVKDAYDASLATIKLLAAIQSCVFLISTHIVEIATELKEIENITFWYFDSAIRNGKPVFDYRLREGVSSETLGYFIFKNEGIIELLETAAKKQK